MIAKAAWFTKRKYSGWGLTPNTWQGALYIILIAGAIACIQSLPLTETIKMISTGAWTIFVFIDILCAMASIKLDEREQKIEAVAERNAAWTMVASSVFSLLYITTIGKELKGTGLVPAFILPIIAGTIAKGVSHFILDKRGI